MKKAIFISFILALSALADFCFSQSYHFRMLSTGQEPANLQVRAMFQDSKGFLWFGNSGSGMCRYDGRNYLFLTKKDGLCSNDVNCIGEDKSGNLWIGTAAGVSQYADGSFINYPEFDNLSFFSIANDKDGNLWMGTSVGLLRFDGKNFHKYTTSEGLPNNFVLALLCDKKGKLWCGTIDGKISVYENGKIHPAPIADLQERIWSMYENDNGEIWIGANNGLWMLNPKNNEIQKNEIGKPILCIGKDLEGNFWFGTIESGVIQFKEGRFKIFSENHVFGSNPIYSILKDREGIMWFGIYGTGVARLNILGYEIFTKSKGLENNFIWAVTQDLNENIWIGYNSPGISVLHRKEKTAEPEVSTFPTGALVYCIFIESENRIWAGTANGIEVFQYENDTKSLKKIRNYAMADGLPGENIRCIYRDKAGHLWIGTNLGLTLMKRKASGDFAAIKTFSAENGLVNNYVYSILEDNQQNFWIATAGGISKLKYDERRTVIKNYGLNEGLSNHDVRSIVSDDKGRLWFATGVGISLYDRNNDSFLNFTSKNGLSSERLYFLHYDHVRNALWIGHSSGIDKLDLTEYNLNRKTIFTHPTSFDAFLEVETNTNAVFMDVGQNLWFGSIDGLIKCFPDYVRPRNPVEPRTQILKTSVNKRDTFLLQGSSLPFDQNSISFQFLGISLSMPERVQYRYILEGFDKDWSPETKDAMATYSNLPAGSYNFKVVACNNDGVWNASPTEFAFSIAPPWWQTWWFRALMAILISASIWTFIKWREKQLREEKQLLEEKVKLRTKELEEQKEMVEEKNREITDSIKYAKRIQTALLTTDKFMKQNLPEHFIFFKPRDIVSGDFYWAHASSDTENSGNSLFFALADCTGHGVPGAMMSMIGINKLSEIVIKKSMNQPDKILNQLRHEIIVSLNPNDYSEDDEYELEIKDGMDIALIKIQNQNNRTVLEYAGANNPIWITRQNSDSKPSHLIEIIPDNFPVGKHRKEISSFTIKTQELQKGDVLYLFSDGFPDQFGGPKGKKFKYLQFKNLFLTICNLPMHEQHKILEKTFESWKGNLSQVDDVSIVGIRI